MGRHVLSDVVVVFGLEQLCERNISSRFSGRIDQLRGFLAQRSLVFNTSNFSDASLNERMVGYEPQAEALGAYYFLMTLPPAMPDGAVRNDWSVGISDRKETPFAVSDPFKDEH
jgi:hypothetical protein